VRVYQFRHFGSCRWVVNNESQIGQLRFKNEGLSRLNYQIDSALANLFFPTSVNAHLVAFDGAGEGVSTVEVGTAAGAGAGVGVGVAVGVAAGCSGAADCSTELVPVMNGSERESASNIKAAAAPIVILDSSVCVPRGPNAVLETELENSAPASALPGWSKIVSTRTTHERINNP
jgi:hypothetical protein